ncbi:MAG: hypothetical protein PSN35_04185, partial [Candidatus Thioglobus sp.]|uniref:hypothetical protein n=1 Tax=Candidatus Thioglobus sp. TaxID=2026721 RepID=UPI002620A7C6
EMDLKVKGKSGDTTVVINFGSIDSTTSATTDTAMNIEDAYVATSVAGVSVKAGQWDNGNNALRASTRNDGKIQFDKEFSGVKVTYGTEAEAKSVSKMMDYVKVAADISGVALSYKKVSAGEDISVSTTVGGVKASYLVLNRDPANTDRSVVEVSGSFSGIDVKVAQATADSGATIEGDTWMGDFEGATGAYDLTAGQDVTSISLKTQMAGNTVEFRNSRIDDVSNEDTSFNKFIVTRPLANGTTFEATYTDLDDKGSTTTDSSTLDLELAVKF